jgi:hypothetical protein
MSAPLEFKRRVRLPEASLEELPERQRRHGLALGGAVWVGAVGLAIAISEGIVPVEHWLQQAVVGAPASPAAARATGSSSTQELPAAPPLAPRHELAATDPQSALEREMAQPEQPFVQQENAPPAEETAQRAQAKTPTAHAPPPNAPPPIAAPETPPPAAPPSTQVAAPPAASFASAGPSCEQAAAQAVQEIEIGVKQGAADLAREDYASVLEHGSYFARCGVPDSMRLDICAAVRGGRAVGVTVRTDPGSRAVAECVARAVRALAFPSHPQLDLVRTGFAPR